jgi:hypothetical protein
MPSLYAGPGVVGVAGAGVSLAAGDDAVVGGAETGAGVGVVPAAVEAVAGGGVCWAVGAGWAVGACWAVGVCWAVGSCWGCALATAGDRTTDTNVAARAGRLKNCESEPERGRDVDMA